MERKIGETFITKEGIKLQVVALLDCRDCFYYERQDECSNGKEQGHCTRCFRKDSASVIFKQIE